MACEAATQQFASAGDIIEDVGVGVEVPSQGTVQAAATAPIGYQTLSVTVSTSGQLIVADCGSEMVDREEPPPPDDDPPSGSPANTENPAPQAPAECADDYFKAHAPWSTAMSWKFNRGTTPSEVGVNPTEAALVEGARAITDANTNCPRGDSIGAAFNYQGDTSLHANIMREGTMHICKDPDGVSVVEFGQLDAIFLGYACWYSPAGYTTEADIRLNKGDQTKWENNVGSCSGQKWIVRSVATHEFGHAFGLDDLDHGRHGNLTMGEPFEYCRQQAYTLGLGDMLGLEALY